jgi:hypothetical protein
MMPTVNTITIVTTSTLCNTGDDDDGPHPPSMKCLPHIDSPDNHFDIDIPGSIFKDMGSYALKEVTALPTISTGLTP